MIKEINKGNDIEISFCGIVYREDRGCKDMIDDTNKKIEELLCVYWDRTHQ